MKDFSILPCVNMSERCPLIKAVNSGELIRKELVEVQKTDKKLKLQGLLEKAGYVVLKNNQHYISQKYKDKDFYPTIKRIEHHNVIVTWDSESIKEYFINKLKIPEEKLELWSLGCGDLPINTRQYRRTFTIGRHSKSFRTQRRAKDQSTTITIRPLLTDIGLSFPYVVKKIKKILNRIKYFNCVTVVYRPGTDTVGAFVSTGGAFKG